MFVTESIPTDTHKTVLSDIRYGRKKDGADFSCADVPYVLTACISREGYYGDARIHSSSGLSTEKVKKKEPTKAGRCRGAENNQ